MRDESWRGVRAFALLDLIVTGLLAVPLLSQHVLALLLSGFGVLGSPSQWLPFSTVTLVFCNLAGVLGVLWNGLRWLHPQALIVRTDQWGRVAVAAVLIFYLCFKAAPVVLWLFVATELAGALVAWRTLRRVGA